MQSPRYSRSRDLPEPPTQCEAFDALWDKVKDARIAYAELGTKLNEVQSAERSADRNYAQEASAAIRAGKKQPKDPREALAKRRESLVIERDVAGQVLNDYADEVDAVVSEHRETWKAAEHGCLEEELKDMEELVEQLWKKQATVAEIRGRLNWLDGGNLAGGYFGTKELNALTKQIDEVRNPPRKRYVDSRNLALLQQRQAAETLDGEHLPAGTSPGAVTLSHSPKGLRESPLGRSSDYS